MTVTADRQSRKGQLAYHAGRAAEARIAQDYARRGMTVARERWRGKGGEIDLILRDGDGLIFVEVKQSRSIAEAASHLRSRQITRLRAAAEEFLAGEPGGSLTDIRPDMALVDASGQFEIIENALAYV